MKQKHFTFQKLIHRVRSGRRKFLLKPILKSGLYRHLSSDITADARTARRFRIIALKIYRPLELNLKHFIGSHHPKRNNMVLVDSDGFDQAVLQHSLVRDTIFHNCIHYLVENLEIQK